MIRESGMSVLAASFAMDVLELGKQGFSDWLVKSFAGNTPSHQLGRFHYDDDMLCWEAFSCVAHEWPEDIKRQALEGVKSALVRFNVDEATYFGMLELYGIGYAIDSKWFGENFIELVSKHLPADGVWKHSRDGFEISALKQFLDIAFVCACDQTSVTQDIRNWARKAARMQNPEIMKYLCEKSEATSLSELQNSRFQSSFGR